MGVNREAAVVSGVNVFATVMGVYVLAACLYGICGVLVSARTAGATGNYLFGINDLMSAILACVVGGVSIKGGKGKVGDVICGVLACTVILYGIQFINLSPMWQYVIHGSIFLFAVTVDLIKYHKNPEAAPVPKPDGDNMATPAPE